MNRVQFGEGGCDKTRKYLDSYVSNELLIETNHEVLRHLEDCAACSAELEARTKMRTRLKAAVKSQPVPPELQVRIREQFQSKRSWFAAGWSRWAVAMAASLALSVGVWTNYSRERLPDLSDRPGQNAYIRRVSASLASVLKPGLADHIHCTIFRKYPRNPPPVEKMEADLGPSYRGLLPVVRASVPEGYRIVMAHQCQYAGRRYIHLTFKKDGELISLVVARKNSGELLAGPHSADTSSGIPIYQAAAGSYKVAGFDAGNFLAYIVSDLKGQANLQIASTLAPGVREFLMKMPA